MPPLSHVSPPAHNYKPTLFLLQLLFEILASKDSGYYLFSKILVLKLVNVKILQCLLVFLPCLCFSFVFPLIPMLIELLMIFS